MIKNKTFSSFLGLSRVYFFSNALYYFTQTACFFYVSTIALPSDLGIASYIISITGIFAVISRYGMPLYLVEYFDGNHQTLDQGFKTSMSFSISFAFFLIPLSLLLSFFINFEKNIYFVYIFSLMLMIIFNPVSMIIQQDIILRKNISKMTLINFLKIIFYPFTVYFVYQTTKSFIWALTIGNISLLFSALSIYLLFYNKKTLDAFQFIDFKKFLSLVKTAFPYFINSLALVLIFSIDKIFVANFFSFNILGSYDLIWKFAILTDFILIQPISSIFTKDILKLGLIKNYYIVILIPLTAIIVVFTLSLFSFDSILQIWQYFFDKYVFDPLIFKYAISFFVFMFSVNQLRNIMANYKLKLSCIASSLITVLPIIFSGIFIEIDSLILIPKLLVIGVFCSMIFNMLILIYIFSTNNKSL